MVSNRALLLDFDLGKTANATQMPGSNGHINDYPTGPLAARRQAYEIS